MEWSEEAHMKRLIVVCAILAFSLSACIDMDLVTAAPNPFSITPSRPPAILSPTPLLVYPTTSETLPPPPSLTPSLTLEPGPSPTFTLSPVATEAFTPSPTVTNTPAPLAIQLLGCDTGIDITHGMGEVTNAYVTLVNAAGPDLTTVCATLSAADEGRVHPDKTVCVPSLPRGYQVTLKLTIDTTFQVNTIVDVAVTSNEGMFASVSGQACRDIDVLVPAPEDIGVVMPIQ
jgi:hypothetical protein